MYSASEHGGDEQVQHADTPRPHVLGMPTGFEEQNMTRERWQEKDNADVLLMRCASTSENAYGWTSSTQHNIWCMQAQGSCRLGAVPPGHGGAENLPSLRAISFMFPGETSQDTLPGRSHRADRQTDRQNNRQAGRQG